jgi:hypothetical protein
MIFFQIKSLKTPSTLIQSIKGVRCPIVHHIKKFNASPYLEVVWPETKQSGLIDSLLHNYYVPPIIFG